MPKTLFGRLLAIVLAFCMLMTSICIVLMRTWHSNYHAEADQMAGRDVAQRIVEANLFFNEGLLDVNNYHRAVANLAAINPTVDSYLLDEQGQILASSLPGERLTRRFVDVTPIEEFLGSDVSLPIFGDDPQRLAGEEVFSAATIIIPGCPASYLYLILHRSDEGSALAAIRRSYTINETVGVLLLSAILAVLATVVLMRVLTRNLGHLEEAMVAFRESGFTTPPVRLASVRPGWGDEIDRLTRMFSELVAKMQVRMQDLRHSDEIRREILANVSHDLRTPLAALSLHLETLALKPDLSAEERGQYLLTSLRQCQGLSTLVEQLLEAARLDAGQVPFEPEPFNIGELLHDVEQKFRLNAEKSGVELRVDGIETLPMVRGDIGLIERALDNLLDNAFQYTKSGDKISISTEQLDTAVRVAVADTGTGFSAPDSEHVTDRFFRVDRSRGQGSGHAGLGLAIVNSIARLHGSQLDIDSVPEHGTTVSFELPIL